MATLAQQLVEAETAYHDLLIGKAARVYVDQNGERVEYVAANRQALAAYIQSLKDQIANPDGVSPDAPLRFLFI